MSEPLRSCRTIIVCAALAFPLQVHAQRPPTPPSGGAASTMSEIARSHLEAGTRYYDLGRYDDAIQEFQRAYDASQMPELLFNLARAQEASGRIEEAVATYQRFLDAGAPGMDRDVLAQRVESLRARATAQRAEREAAAQRERERLAEIERLRSAGQVNPPTTARTRTVYRRSTLDTVGPFVLFGLGAGAGAGAVYGMVRHASAVADYDRVNQGQVPWSDAAGVARTEAETGAIVAWSFGAAGAALIASGALWLAFRGRGAPREVVSAFVVPTEHGALAGIGGRL